MTMNGADMPTFETLSVTLENHIATVRLNRPEKANAMNAAMWQDIRQAFEWVDATPEARVAVLQGEGKYFTAGIDLQMMMGLGSQIADDCDGRMREKLRRLILDLQDTLTSLERCRKPVLAAIAGGCIGGGIDLITCADMRYAQATPSSPSRKSTLAWWRTWARCSACPSSSARASRASWPTPGASSMRPRHRAWAW